MASLRLGPILILFCKLHGLTAVRTGNFTAGDFTRRQKCCKSKNDTGKEEGWNQDEVRQWNKNARSSHHPNDECHFNCATNTFSATKIAAINESLRFFIFPNAAHASVRKIFIHPFQIFPEI